MKLKRQILSLNNVLAGSIFIAWCVSLFYRPDTTYQAIPESMWAVCLLYLVLHVVILILGFVGIDTLPRERHKTALWKGHALLYTYVLTGTSVSLATIIHTLFF